MVRGRGLFAGTATALLVAVGCSTDRGHVPTAETVDSAGLSLVTYDLADIEVPGYRFVGEHELQIGELDGVAEYTFSRITDLASATDGSILVSDGVAQELRVYDSSGTYQRTIGGPGEGPGEFAAAPTIAGLAGDTVFAFDSRSGRVTSFLLDGDLITTTTMRNDDIGLPQVMLRQDDGTYLSQSTWVNPGALDESYEMRLELDSIVIERLDATGMLIDTVRVLADRNRARSVDVSDGGLFRTRQAVTPYAARATLGSDGKRIVLGRNDSFELVLLGFSPRSETVLRVRGVQHPATSGEIVARQEQNIRDRIGDRELDPMTRRINIEYLPERLPAFGTVIVSDDGDVWVSLTEFDASEGLDWLVFSANGDLRGTVHTPPDLRLREIRDDIILGYVQDDFDVPYVRRYRLMTNVDNPN